MANSAVDGTVHSKDFSEAKSKMMDASSRISRGVSDLVGETKGIASLGQEIAVDSLSHGMKVAGEQSGELLCAVKDSVKKHPLQSMAVAGVVGLLIGAYIKRS